MYVIKIGGEYADHSKILEELKGFKEIDLPLFSRKIREYSLQDRLSNRAFFLITMLFNEDYSNDRLRGAIETIVALLRDEEDINPDFICSICKFEEMLETRAVM